MNVKKRLARNKRWRDRHREEIRILNALYYQKNRQRLDAKTRAWQKANPLKHRHYCRRWQNQNSERVAATHREWERLNKESISLWRNKWKSENRDKIRSQNRAWARANIELIRQYRRDRISRLAGAPGKFSVSDWILKVEFYGWKCRYCGTNLTRSNLSQDHAIAVSRGGTNWLSNAIPCCRRCNSSKGNKTFFEFLGMVRRRH